MPTTLGFAFEYIRSLWLRTILYLANPFMRHLLPDPYTEAGNRRVESKPVHESRVTMTEIISPAHANIKGLAYAGVVLGWIDVAAGIAAKRHASVPSVTRSVDDVAFLNPIKVGDILTIQASVNKSWKTSMEVGIKVEAESPFKAERYFVAHAYLTFVALSPRPVPWSYLGKKLVEYHPIRVPEIIPHSDIEKKRYEMAETRRRARFARQQPDHSGIRLVMKEYSQGLRQRSDDNAPIRQRHAFRAARIKHELTRPGDAFEDEGDEQLKATLHGQDRRYSVDPLMARHVDEMRTDATFAEVVELVMPQHANTLSITFGGQIMAWMEACAMTSANRLAKAYLLTASIDSLNFITPTRVGDVVTVRSIVSRTFTSSMEVYVSVEAENLQTGKTTFTNDGFFTIAAVDGRLCPLQIPSVVPVAEAEKDIHSGSRDRRAKRLLQREELIDLVESG